MCLIPSIYSDFIVWLFISSTADLELASVTTFLFTTGLLSACFSTVATAVISAFQSSLNQRQLPCYERPVPAAVLCPLSVFVRDPRQTLYN